MRHPIPSAALDDRLGFLGTSGSGKTYNAGTAIEMVLGARKGRVIIIDPLGVWWGLRLLADGKKPSRFDVAIFGGPHGDIPLTENAGALIGETAATMNESCILDLSELASKAADRRFMLAFLDSLFRKAAGEPFHLVVDEADLFAPQKPTRPGDEMLLHHMEQIVRRGRVKGFIPWLISQRPAVLNKNVLSQVDGLIAFKLTSSQDRDALDAWIEGQADKAQGREIKGRLPTLQIGQGIVWLPGRGILQEAQFPPKVTYDSSRTPKRGEKKKRTAKLKPLDLGKLRDSLATVEAEAKASDPRALRADIAKLQQEKAALEKQVAAAAGAKPVADKAALEAAEKCGFERAIKEAVSKAKAELAGALSAVTDDVNQMGAAVKNAVELFHLATADRLKVLLHDKEALKPVYAPPPPALPRAASTVLPKTPSQVNSAPPKAVPREAPPAADGQLTGAQRKILRSLATWLALGHATPSREMVAAIAGYPPTSGGFKNPLGALNSAGLITYPMAGHVSLAALDLGEAMSRDDARAVLFNNFTGAQRKIVIALLEQGVRSREDVANDAGYPVDSGGFKNPLGALRTLGVLDYPQQGLVELSPWAEELFAGYRSVMAA